MKPSHSALFRFLGFNTQGDIGGLTMYRSKRKALIIFASTSPKEPPSRRQIVQRNRLRLVGRQWQALPADERRRWELAARLAHLRVSGFNLFTYWLLRNDRAAVATIEHQSGITLSTSAIPV